MPVIHSEFQAVRPSLPGETIDDIDLPLDILNNLPRVYTSSGKKDKTAKSKLAIAGGKGGRKRQGRKRRGPQKVIDATITLGICSTVIKSQIIGHYRGNAPGCSYSSR